MINKGTRRGSRSQQRLNQQALIAENIEFDGEKIRKSLESYGDLVNEFTKERAILRALNRNREEVDSGVEEERKKKARSAGLAEVLKNPLNPIKALTESLDARAKELQSGSKTEMEALDQYVLDQATKDTYMPDDVFEKSLNELGSQSYKMPEMKYPSNTPFNLQLAIPYGVAYIYNHITKPIGDKISSILDNHNKQEAIDEFYKYTPLAHADAKKRYMEKMGVTDLQANEAGVDPTKAKQKDPLLDVYHKLTQPEAYQQRQNKELGELIYGKESNVDKTFGTSQWRKDASTRFLENLNEAQIDDFRGRIIASKEIEDAGNDAIMWYRNQPIIDDLKVKIKNLQDRKNAGENIPDSEIQRRLQILGMLEEEQKTYEHGKALFEEFVPQDNLDQIISKSERILDNLQSTWFGGLDLSLTAPIFNDVDALRSKLVGFNTAKLEDKERILAEFKEARKKKVDLWNNGIYQNNKDLERIRGEHKVSDFFKFWEENGSGDILSGNTWAYQQPGFMGSSNSAWLKQLPGYALALVASRGIGNVARGIMAGTSFAGSHSAAQSENFAEVTENYRQRLKDQIAREGSDVYERFIDDGKKYLEKNKISSEDPETEVLNQYIQGNYRPTKNVQKILYAATNATRGVNALFERDMVATDIDNLVNTAIMFSPFGQESRLTKAVGTLGEGGSPIVGISKAAFMKTPVGKQIEKSIDDVGSFISAVPNKIYNRAKKLAPEAIKTKKMRATVEVMESWVNNPANRLGSHIIYKNLKEVGKRSFLSMISEGIEEGKQYTHGKAYRAGEFDDSITTYGTKNIYQDKYDDPSTDWFKKWIDVADYGKWLDDVAADFKSAAVIAGMPFWLEGMSDPELVRNIKGGMAGGLFLTGVMSAGTAVTPTILQYKIGKWLLNNAIAEKAAKTDLYEKAKLYAQKAIDPASVSAINEQFNYIIEQHKKNKDKDWYIPEQILEQQKRMFNSVVLTANSSEVKNRAEELGIDTRSQKYYDMVAVLSSAVDDQNEAIRKTQPLKTQLMRWIAEHRIPTYTVTEQGKLVKNIRVGGVTSTVAADNLTRTKEDGTVESSQEAADRLNNYNYRLFQLAAAVKTLQGLIARADLAEYSSDFFGDSAASLKFMKNRLKFYLDRQLEHIKESKDREKFLKNLDKFIGSYEDASDFMDAYRGIVLGNIDSDYASMMFKSVMGKNAQIQPEETKTEEGVNVDFLFDSNDDVKTLDNIIKAYNDRVTGDNALYDALEEDYIERYDKLEQERIAKQRAAAIKDNPELAAVEEIVHAAEATDDKSYVTLNPTKDNKGSDISPYDTAKTAAKTILSAKKITSKVVKDAFKKAGMVVPNANVETVVDLANMMKDGKITEQDFALSFVPKESRAEIKGLDADTGIKPEEPLTKPAEAPKPVPTASPATPIKPVEEKKAAGPTKKEVTPKKKDSKATPVNNEISKVISTIKDVIKGKFSKQDLAFLEFALSGIDGNKPLKEIEDAIEDAFRAIDKAKYWYNMDAYKDKGLRRSSVVNAIIKNTPAKKEDTQTKEERPLTKEEKNAELDRLAGIVKDLLLDKPGVDEYGSPDEIRSATFNLCLFFVQNMDNVDFISYAKMCIEKVGDVVKPYLKSSYLYTRRSVEVSAELMRRMDSELVIDKIDVDNLDAEGTFKAAKEKLDGIKDSIGRLLSKIDFFELAIAEANVSPSIMLKVIKLQAAYRAVSDLVDTIEKLILNRDLRYIESIGKLPATVAQLQQQIKTLEEEYKRDGKEETDVKAKEERKLYLEYLDLAVQNIAEQMNYIVQEQVDALTELNRQFSGFINKLNLQTNTKEDDDDVLRYIKQADKLLDYIYSIGTYQYIDKNLINNTDLLIRFLETKGYKANGFVENVGEVEYFGEEEWKKWNTTHARSFYDSVATDDTSMKLSDVTSNEDFIEKSTFIFSLDTSEQNTQFPQIRVTITYNGHTYTPIDIWDSRDGTFGNKVREILTADPNAAVTAKTVNRTNGRIKSTNEMHLLTEVALVKDVYNIAFDNEQDEFFLTDSVMNPDGTFTTIATKPGINNNGKTQSFQYRMKKGGIKAGAVVFRKRLNYSEDKTKEGHTVPINVYGSLFTDGDAQFLVDMFTGKYSGGIVGQSMLGQEFASEDGQKCGLTCEQLINMLIPVGLFNKKRSDLVRIEFGMNDGATIILKGKLDGDEKSMSRVYNLNVEKDRDAFKKIMTERVRKNIAKMILTHELGKSARQPTNPFNGLYEYLRSPLGKRLAKQLKDGKKLTFGNSSIVIDWDDVSDNKRNGGITGLGWYVKNGFLVTPYVGVSESFLNFDDAVRVDEDKQTPSKEEKKNESVDVSTKKSPVESKEVVSANGVTIRRRGKKVMPKISDERNGRSRTAVELREVLSEIIPVDSLIVRTSEGYLDDEELLKLHGATNTAAHIVGKSYSDAIVLWEYAKEGVEYHEAFHRIAEIFLDDKLRNKIYNWYKKVWKKTHKGEPTERDIIEGAADHFMYFMMNREMLVTDHGVLELFKSLWRIINFYKSIGSFGLYMFYKNIANGAFRDFLMDDAAKHRADEFERLHPGGYAYVVNGVEMKSILNESMYKDLIQSLVYIVMNANNIELDGSNIQELSLDKDLIKNSDIYQDYTEPDDMSIGAQALREAIENWDAVSMDVAAAISSFATDYVVSYEKEMENAEEAQDEDVSAANISEHIRASYEFSQFSRASSRVKFFFSMIAAREKVDDNGVVDTYDKVNGLGLPFFMDSKYIFNDILNQLHDIDSLSELIARLRVLKQDDPIYELIYDKIIKAYASVDKGGIDADAEALLTQIFNVLKSNKQEFIIARANMIGSGTDVGYTVTLENTDLEYNARQIKRQWSQLFAHGGSMFVESDGKGGLKMKDGIPAKMIPAFWNLIGNTAKENNGKKMRLGMKWAFSDEGLKASEDPSVAPEDAFYIKVRTQGGFVNKKINPKNENDLSLCKAKFIEVLNAFGIQFDRNMLDYMLRQKYGDSGFKGMKQMFEETGNANIDGATFAINGFTYTDEHGVELLNSEKDNQKTYIGGIGLDNLFGAKGFGFIGELADYKYKYQHAHDQLSVLAVAGNKFYVISENNYLSDVTHILQRAITQEELPELFDQLRSYSYNAVQSDENEFGEQETMGSLIIKQIEEWRKLKPEEKRDKEIKLITFTGMKSSIPGDLGVDYVTISKKDDYVSKMAILFDGGIIFPTMSDKKTWVYLKGFTLPGINWKKGIDLRDVTTVRAYDAISGKELKAKRSDGEALDLVDIQPGMYYTVSQRNTVLELLRQYFLTEHASIAEVLADYTSLREEDRIKNYHNGAKVTDKHGNKHAVIQGARHMSLLNLYDEKYNLIPTSRVLDENGEYISEIDEYNKLDELFFLPSDENGEIELSEDLVNRQYRFIERILTKRLEEELAKLERMGLVKKTGSGNTIYDYENVGIDKEKVDAAFAAILQANGLRTGDRHVNVNGEDVIIPGMTPLENKQCRSLALAMVVNDAMVKAIISKNETERIFSGNPAFFKMVYDDNGHLIDRSSDEHKRIGGNVSTGQNAATWLKDMPQYIRSAEIDNEMVQAENADELEEMMRDGQLRRTLINYLQDESDINMEDDVKSKEIVESVKSLSIDEVVEKLKDIDASKGTEILKVAEKIAKAKSDAFRIDRKRHLDGIDVADGGAYVTDDIFEQLLRSVGNYTKDILKAFAILRGEEVDGKKYTVKDTLEITWAYELIYTKVIGTLKYTAYGMRWQTRPDGNGGTTVPYYDKFALFPIFKSMATGNMAKIYKAMKDQHVDMLKINSAVKLGSQGSKPLNFDEYAFNDDINDARNYKDGVIKPENRKADFNDAINGFKFNTYVQRTSELRKQFNTDPNEKELLTMGTQMTKIVMEALFPGQTYTTQDGRKLSAKQIRDDIMLRINRIAGHGNTALRNEFFNKDGSLNLKNFSKLIKDELIRRGAGKDVIDGFTVLEDKKGNQRFKITMGAQGNADWIQSIIAAAVNKRIIDINTPGNLFIQRSVWAMLGETFVTGDTDLPQSINNGNRLLMINEEGSMDCVLSIDYFEDILPKVPKRNQNGEIIYKRDDNGNFIYKKDKDGEYILNKKGEKIKVPETTRMPFAQARDWLIKNGIIGPNAKANIVGYRIPTQAISSIHALRCVDVLPIVRDTVILPEEFTKITGSDFDIDKLFLSRLNYKRVDGQLTDVFDENTTEQDQNLLIKDYIALLLDKETEDGKTRNVLTLHGSIDNDTKLLKDIIKELEVGISASERLTYQDYTLSNEVDIKQDFVTGKSGIGPFALNNNSHVLTMLYGVRFANKRNSIMSRLKLTRLDRSTDRDGESIMSWLSGLINAHVDIAKDSYISRLNVNPFTYNLVNLLIRTGLGKYTFYFTTQPIMMKLGEIYSNAGGVYGVDKTKTTSQVRREATRLYIVDYINKNLQQTFKDYQYDAAIKYWKDHMRKIGVTDLNAAIDSLFDKKNDLMKLIAMEYKKDPSKLFDKEDPNDLKYILHTRNRAGTYKLSTFDMLMLILEAYNQFTPYAQALSDVVKYSKIDTKKQGKTITEQFYYTRGVFNTFVNGKTAKMFTSSLLNMYRNSYIKTKTDLAVGAYEDIMSAQLIQATPQFKQLLFGSLSRIGLIQFLNKNPEQITEDFIKHCTESMLQFIRSKYINSYAKRHNIDIKGLVNGDNTIYDRLVLLKINLQTQNKYINNYCVNGEINNYFLRALVDGVNQLIDQEVIEDGGGQHDAYTNVKFVKLMNFMEDDNIDVDAIRSGWDDMLNDNRFPEVLEFARDLIVYSYITANGNGVLNLTKYVPNSWKILPDNDSTQESFNSYMEKVLREYNENNAPAIDFDDIVLNNWLNYAFIPTERMSYGDTLRFQPYYPRRVKTENKKSVYYDADYPIILSGVTINEDGTASPTYNEDPDSDFYRPAPKYIKTERVTEEGREDIDQFSQRRFNIYKRIAYGYTKDKDGNNFAYPIYVLVGPKGNKFKNGTTITEYGRSDSEYNEVSASIQEDPLLSTISTYTGVKYTSIETFLSDIIRSKSIGEVAQFTSQFLRLEYTLEEGLFRMLNDYKSWLDFVSDEGASLVLRTRYTRESALADPTTLYIFTDNTDRSSGDNLIDPTSWYAQRYAGKGVLKYPFATSAVIRGLDNARPISTKKSFYKNQLFNDSNIEELKTVVESELVDIQEAWYSGRYRNIILPRGGFVNGQKSMITNDEGTKKCYEYLMQVEQRIYDMVEKGIPLVLGKSRTFKMSADANYYEEYNTAKEQLMKQRPTDAVSALELIISNTKDTTHGEIATRLLDFVRKNNIPIKWVDRELTKFVAHYVPNIESGKELSANDGYIEVNYPKQVVSDRTEEIILHEILHSATSIYLRTHKDASDAIQRYMDYVHQYIEHKNAFKNPREFLANAFTSSQFNAELKEIPAMDAKLYNNIFLQLFENIKDIIYQILGISDANVIDQLSPVLDRILQLQEDSIASKEVVTDIIDNYNSDEMLPDEHGNLYGWSVESIYNHLLSYVTESTGYSEKQRRMHVKDVNKLYGTNFGVYKDEASGQLKVKNNTVPQDKLKLTENPNAPKQLSLFDSYNTEEFTQLGEEFMKKCKQ